EERLRNDLPAAGCVALVVVLVTVGERAARPLAPGARVEAVLGPVDLLALVLAALGVGRIVLARALTLVVLAALLRQLCAELFRRQALVLRGQALRRAHAAHVRGRRNEVVRDLVSRLRWLHLHGASGDDQGQRCDQQGGQCGRPRREGSTHCW